MDDICYISDGITKWITDCGYAVRVGGLNLIHQRGRCLMCGKQSQLRDLEHLRATVEEVEILDEDAP